MRSLFKAILGPRRQFKPPNWPSLIEQNFRRWIKQQEPRDRDNLMLRGAFEAGWQACMFELEHGSRRG